VPVELSSSTPTEPALPPAPTLPRVAPTAQPLQLSDEANLIDEAREAIAGGDAPGALRILENHRRRFPQPRLQPEALYLRMQALRLEGHLEAAIRVAQHLLAEYPNGPQSAAARAVVNAEGR
jgi:outer membrane protein assembly factor BamD (BamD/ComL family)